MTKQWADLSNINPMIERSGNTYCVGSVLETLAALVDQRQSIAMDEAQAFGISIVLRTCAAALRHMQEEQA